MVHRGVVPGSNTLRGRARIQLMSHDHRTSLIVRHIVAVIICPIICWLGSRHVRIVGKSGGPDKRGEIQPFITPVVGLCKDVFTTRAASEW